MQPWTQHLKNLLNLFLYSHCPLCQRSATDGFCRECNRKLQMCQLSDPCLFWCQRLPVFAWGGYGGLLKRAIAVMKYDNHPEIASPLGHWLGTAWQLYSPNRNQQLVVVPIPLHPSKQTQRGYNQAALIARSFCATTGLQLKLNGLQRIRATRAQFELSVQEREKNLASAFALGRDFSQPPSLPVLLVDDVYTTGATAKSAIQTLHQAGITVLGIVVTAVAQKNALTKN